LSLLQTGAVPREDWGYPLPLKPTKVTRFTMISYNSENNIRD